MQMVNTRISVTQHCPSDPVIRTGRAEEMQHTTLSDSTEIRPGISGILIWHRWSSKAISTKH